MLDARSRAAVKDAIFTHGQTRAMPNLFDEDGRVAIRSRPNLMVKSG